ncbi:MAG: NADP-dependent oxidoreductase [Gammaproteobacteria bacterium]
MRNRNRQWRLAAYPDGMPKESDWALSESAIPEPGPGQVLAQALYLDVAPYMRGRISPQKNYAAGVSPGDVMVGGGIAKIVRSHSADYKAGDIVVTDFGFGWQDYAVLDPITLRRVDATLAPLPCWMDILGLNGVTAYFGLFDAASMRAGDTVVVSAAAGSVGQLVGPLAKLAGGRAIAITSSTEKLAWCRELGFDDGIDYRVTPDLRATLAKVCPHGVDVFFDNTAGPIHDAMLQNLAPRARIVLCGSVSLAGTFGQPDIGPRFLRNLMVARARVQGFLVLDYQSRYPEAWARLAAWRREGKIKQRYDIATGLESAPNAFLRLLTSQNLGKQLVKVSDEPA